MIHCIVLRSRLRTLICLLPLLLSLFSCSRSRVEDDSQSFSSTTLKIDTFSNVSYSDLFSGFEIIPLETTEENLTGRAITVRIIGDRIYVCDKSGNKSIDIYTLDGDFLFRIQNVGRGPDEYMRIYDYDVDLETGDVMILDGVANKGLLVFDANTGLYKKSIPLPPPGRFESFIKHGDKFLFHTGSGSADDPESAMLYVSDEKGEILEKHLYFGNGEVRPSRFRGTGGYNGRFYRTDNGIRIFCSWDNTIYSYNDRVVNRFLTIDDTEPPIPEPPAPAPGSPESLSFNKKGVMAYSENQNYVHIAYYLVAGIPATIVYNKSTETYVAHFGFKNDLAFHGPTSLMGIYGDLMVSIYSPGWGVEGNNLITNIRAGDILMESEKAERLIEKMIRNTEQGGGASNPILILYELKME